MMPVRPIRTAPIPLALLALALALPAAAGDKKVIETRDDMPRHSYPVDGTVVALMQDDAAFEALAAAVEEDLLAVNEEYDIADASARQDVLRTLRALAMMRGDADAVRGYTETIRELEDKEALRLTDGVVYEAILQAREETDTGATAEALQGSVQEILAERYGAMPWDVVGDQLESLKGSMEIYSDNLLLGIVQSQIDPPVAKTGVLSSDQAHRVVGIQASRRITLAYQDAVLAAVSGVIAANRVEKPDIWPARTLTFTGDEGYHPVRLGIWDSGVDVDVFPGQVFVNPREVADGTDTDGNGFVDDRHGIGYDVDWEKDPPLLYPLGDFEARRTELEDQSKGFTDVRSSIDSEEATALKRHISTLQPDQVQGFIESLNLYSMHAHGTHVAGIALEGNPFAEVLVARISFDHRAIPEPWTDQTARNFAAMARDTVAYFQAHGVRAVNMSWGISLKEIEDGLEKNGIGETPEQRGELARAMFDVANQGLYDAMAGAPEILFLVAAGNADADVAFDQFIPSSYDLPNVLVSGAVDQAGEATSFTSFGDTVKLYASGFEVVSEVPGGRELAFSGTSMASPGTLNLVGKLLAVDPELTPADLIELILAGCEEIGEDPALLVIHPQRTLELLQKRGE